MLLPFTGWGPGMPTSVTDRIVLHPHVYPVSHYETITMAVAPESYPCPSLE